MMCGGAEVIGPLLLEMVVGEQELVLHGGGDGLSGFEESEHFMKFVHPEAVQEIVCRRIGFQICDSGSFRR